MHGGRKLRRREDQSVSRRALRGRAAERVAVDWLVLDGYDILGTNVRLGALEVDVLARKGPHLVVVEVRTRGKASWQSAFGSVTGPKRRRLQRAVELVWRRAKHDATLERIRVDVVAVDLDATPVTVEVARAVLLSLEPQTGNGLSRGRGRALGPRGSPNGPSPLRRRSRR